MRKPTAKEKMILRSCLEGLTKDVEAVVEREPNRDVLGTFRVNVTVMTNILKKLESGTEF
jgi:hypothetical protein